MWSVNYFIRAAAPRRVIRIATEIAIGELHFVKILDLQYTEQYRTPMV